MIMEAFSKKLKKGNEGQKNDSVEGADIAWKWIFVQKSSLNKTDSHKTERKICVTEDH